MHTLACMSLEPAVRAVQTLHVQRTTLLSCFRLLAVRSAGFRTRSVWGEVPLLPVLP
jgi:hypothetical protein